MQVDTILAALREMQQRLMVVGGAYGVDDTARRIRILDGMRAAALTERSDKFTDYCQTGLASGRGDEFSDVLDEFFEQLGLGSETGTWEDMAALVLVD